ncbi:MAG: NADP-dependent oxidoreductase [Rhizobiales bacterium 65-9]|nr:aldo/keto reductase [Hyphomicrobiales bacterium]OJY35324.1 MAG: NADP-dependent oxidoreductase [Rhizobiales bacterium 65-9]
MQYVQLGASGVRASRLWLGVMMFGLRTDEAEAREIVAVARDAALNAIDTADVYAGGESERITGRLIAEDRARWILATKVTGKMGDDPNSGGASRRWLMQAVENSLRRLGTDWIDIYYLHSDDMKTPLEETIAAMGDLIRAGKIRYFALSNFRAWRVARAVELCRAMNVPQPILLQSPYSAVTRGIETEIIPSAVYYGLGLVAYSPLARGVLTAKYAPDAAPDPTSRAGRGDKRMMETEFRQDSLIVAQRIAKHAEATKRSPTEFAVAWALANRYITGVISGPRTVHQMKTYLAATTCGFDAADEAFVDLLVAPGHATGVGYTDPSYPVLGRALGDAGALARYPL